jgi:hypothetical protein
MTKTRIDLPEASGDLVLAVVVAETVPSLERETRGPTEGIERTTAKLALAPCMKREIHEVQESTAHSGQYKIRRHTPPAL